MVPWVHIGGRHEEGTATQVANQISCTQPALNHDWAAQGSRRIATLDYLPQKIKDGQRCQADTGEFHIAHVKQFVWIKSDLRHPSAGEAVSLCHVDESSAVDTDGLDVDEVVS